MINKLDKKGEISPVQFVLAGGLLIIIFLALGSGGGKAIANIFSFLAKLPGWVYIVLIVLFIFGGKRK